MFLILPFHARKLLHLTGVVTGDERCPSLENTCLARVVTCGLDGSGLSGRDMTFVMTFSGWRIVISKPVSRHGRTKSVR